jgi:hypothetical protein
MSVQITRRQITDGAINNAKIDAAAAIASTKLATMTADRNFGGFKAVNLADGTAATDAVTKGQLDAAITASAAGLAVKQPVRVASTTNVSGTYAATGGASARGQFTAMPNALDGVTLAAGNRVLLKNQSTAAQNGIYVVTTLGTGANGVWDRATDADGDPEVTDGTAVMVGEGTANATTQWVLTTNAPITVGGASGSALTFAQFGAGATYTADETTLTVSANQFSIKPAGVGTTQLANTSVTTGKIATGAVTANELGTNAVTTAKILDANVTTAKIATGAVTANELASNAVTAVKILADAVTTAKILDANVTAAKLSSDAVTTVKILDANVTTAKIAGNAVTGSKVSFLAQTVTGLVNGSNTNYTMSGTPTAASLIVWLNGVRQRPTTDFTFSSTTLTFATAPETGDDIAVFGLVA